MPKLIFVNAESNAIRRETLSGIDYLVMPVVMAVEGVMNGVYYPIEALATNIESWHGLPVPLGDHVYDGAGNAVSANSPETVAGNPATIWNPHIEGNALKAEVWIDIDRANKLGGDPAEAVKRLQAGEVLEVSTGLFINDFTVESGEYNGKAYVEIAKDIIGDHLAILLNAPGACSVNDGCGVPRINRDQNTIKAQMELTLTDQDALVWEAWHEKSDWIGQVREVFADRLIYKKGMQLYQIGYAIDPETNAVTFDEEPIKVEYQPVTNMLSKIHNAVMGLFEQKEANMDKQQLIARLVANQWCRLNEDALEKLEAEDLAALEESLNAPVDEAPPADEADQTPAWAQALISKVEGMEAKLQANVDREAGELATQIVANSDFTADELAGKSLTELQKLWRIINPPQADFTGQGVVNLQANQGEWEAYESPIKDGE